MIVVDTTVWIDFLEAKDTPFDLHLKELSLDLTDLIYCEVLQGILNEDKFRQTRNILRAYPILQMRGLRTFEHARIWQLRNNATAYEAAYLALAEALNASLVTRDGSIATIPGDRARVILL